MANIKDIRVWTKEDETRVYVHTDDGREGCLYHTGNRWHKPGEREGRLSESEWAAARALANKKHSKGKGWATIYGDDMWRFDDEKRAAHMAAVAVEIEKERAANANKRVETCAHCGETIAIGAGWGEYISSKNTDEEDLDFVYGGRTGWFYYHNDSSICERARAAEKQAARDAAAKEQERKDEAQKLSERVQRATGLTEQIDWSWDDFGYYVEDVLAESEHYIARRYTSTRDPDLKHGEPKIVLGFVIKAKK